MGDRARSRTLSGPAWAPGTTQATYLTKVLDLAWTEEMYGGTLVLKVTKNRDNSIVEAGVYKKDNGSSEEVRIGADMDVYRLIGLYLVAPQMFNTELTDVVMSTETDVLDAARARWEADGLVRFEDMVDDDAETRSSPQIERQSELRKKMDAAARIEREIDETSEALLRSTKKKGRGATDPELMTALSEHGLMGFADMLKKAMISDTRSLKLHSLRDLEEALSRKGVGGNNYLMTKLFKTAWMESGLLKNQSKEPPPPDPDQEDPEKDSADNSETSSDEPNPTAKEPPRGIPQPRPTWSQATGVKVGDLSSSPHASAMLLGATQGSGVNFSCLLAIDKILYASVGVSHDAPTTIVGAIDSIEVTLEDGISTGKWKLSELIPSEMTERGIEKLCRKLALKSIKASRDKGQNEDGGMRELASTLMEAQANILPHSNSDFKVMEELEASRARLLAVADDPVALKALLSFVGVLRSSEVTEGEKMIAYENLAVKNVTVSQLLKSAHVREPKGTLSSNLRAAVDGYRSALNGIKSAAKAVMRDKLPHNAEPKLLIEAVFAGKLGTSSEFSVHAIVEPGKPRSWLGTPMPSEGSKKKVEGEDIGYLITLFTALPQIGYALEILMPNDKTVTETWASICAEIARGLRRGGVVGAVDNVLAPLLKAYEEKWEQYQKLSSAQLPTLKEVWLAERTSTTMSAYLSATALLVSAGPAGSSSVGQSDIDKQYEKRFKQLEDKLNKSLSDAEGDDDKDKAAKKKAKKERQKASKAKKEAEAKAASGAE